MLLNTTRRTSFATYIKHMWFWVTRYMIVARWEGLDAVHWAKTETEAIEWMRCYPDGLAAYGKRGRLIAARWTA